MTLFALAAVAGLAVLAKAADEMVVGAARISAALRVSPVVIGAVVIGFGTSAPELLVSVLAAGQGSLDIAFGNIAGSNVANLSLVLGVAALVTPIVVDSATLRREGRISTAAVVLFALAAAGGLRRWEGVVLLVLLGAAMFVLLSGSRQGEDDLVAEVGEYLDDGEQHRLGREALRTVAGLAGTMAGAQALVWGASGIAEEMGLAEGFVGLTLVALGTSLPELLTAVQAARRGEDELIVGNLLGSNLFNSLAVGGAAAVVGPGPLDDPDLGRLASLLMVAVAVAALAFLRTGHRIVRPEAAMLLAGYGLAVPLLAS